MWYYLPYDELPVLTMVGSSNYGQQLYNVSCHFIPWYFRTARLPISRKRLRTPICYHNKQSLTSARAKEGKSVFVSYFQICCLYACNTSSQATSIILCGDHFYNTFCLAVSAVIWILHISNCAVSIIGAWAFIWSSQHCDSRHIQETWPADSLAAVSGNKNDLDLLVIFLPKYNTVIFVL